MIRFSNVGMTYHARNLHKVVLRDTSFTIRRGDSLGICGANGAGKSTLLRLIAGVEHPTAGAIRRGMSVSWPIGYTSAFQTSLTGADNTRFIARIYRRPVAPLLASVEDFAQLGTYFHQPVRTYSSGMYARLAFAISLAIRFDCYLIDEVIAAGDERFRERSHEALAGRRREGTLVMVSHASETLRAYCQRGAVLANNTLRFFETIDEALDVHAWNQRRAA
ncbi:capsular polysaccharide transport system ATP-binding protein [Hephaestia caeni]|uniref:Capsular polysaccharide transport system ATP-binding protein n=1 Tax=Hephaestia caeni TaxID=645617 RepID=A0A397PGK6_9SPHN|nr:ABC transporter ATP-binding protein [Hephaestia caeni]RIA46307.1 capsular polysaccharide transport system ATP-binding protein [Hephaestia caeni]